MLFFWVGDDDTHLIFLADTVRPEKGNFLLSELSGLFPAVLGTEPHVTPTASASKLAALATTLCVFLLASPPHPSWLVIQIQKQENDAFIPPSAFAREGWAGRERRTPVTPPG